MAAAAATLFRYTQSFQAHTREVYEITLTSPDPAAPFALRYTYQWNNTLDNGVFAEPRFIRHAYDLIMCQTAAAADGPLCIRYCRYAFTNANGPYTVRGDTETYVTVNSDTLDEDFIADLELFFGCSVVVDYDAATPSAIAKPDIAAAALVADHITERRYYPSFAASHRRAVLEFERRVPGVTYVQCQTLDPDPENSERHSTQSTYVYVRRDRDAAALCPWHRSAYERFVDATWRLFHEDYRHSFHWADAARLIQRAWLLRYRRRWLAAALAGLRGRGERPVPRSLCREIMAFAGM